MNFNLFTRRRTVHDQEVREPTLLAIGANTAGVVVLLTACAGLIVAFSAFGYRWWVFGVVTVGVAWLAWGLRRKVPPPPVPPTGRQRWLRRILRLGRLNLIGVLTGWLGLILWSALCPDGPAPPAKPDPKLIRVVTWNVHCGQDQGVPWRQFDWPARKPALRAALGQARPDILCVQESLPAQVAFLEETLPDHRRFGIGRDGAEAGGEHCAIYFDRRRFEQLGGDTFWLEEPTDRPADSPALGFKRVCTWVRLRDRAGGRTLRIYNAHLYLTAALRLEAAKLILAHIEAGDPADAVLLAADFNAPPDAPGWRLFLDAGLADSAERAGKPAGRPTFHLYGIGLRCLDGILIDSKWSAQDHRVLDVKPGNTFPSDHFAVLADLALPD